jgi:hypothetical protein
MITFHSYPSPPTNGIVLACHQRWAPDWDIVLINFFVVSILLFFFALLIQKDRGTGPGDVLASYSTINMNVVLNPILPTTIGKKKDK